MQAKFIIKTHLDTCVKTCNKMNPLKKKRLVLLKNWNDVEQNKQNQLKDLNKTRAKSVFTAACLSLWSSLPPGPLPALVAISELAYIAPSSVAANTVFIFEWLCIHICCASKVHENPKCLPSKSNMAKGWSNKKKMDLGNSLFSSEKWI